MASQYRPLSTWAITAQAFILSLSHGELQEAVRDFDEALLSAMPTEALGEFWKSLIATVGSFVSVEATSSPQTVGEHEVVVVSVKFQLATIELQITFNSSRTISGFHIVGSSNLEGLDPPYALREDFVEREVSVGEGSEWALPGVLCLPAERMKRPERGWPAVVLVHGSGPLDKDATLGQNKPFRDIAWGLAVRGVAVLRYDKRTYARRYLFEQHLEEFTLEEETILDAVAAYTLLASHSAIDSRRVFILGHSMGGTVIPRIARRCAPAGCIVMAGGVRSLDESMIHQFRYICRVCPAKEAELAKEIARVEQARALLDSPSFDLSTPRELLLHLTPRYWKYLRELDCLAEAKQVTQRMLFLQGEKDYQVTLEDFARWRDALAHKANARFTTYANLNHLFMPIEGESTPENTLQPGHVSLQVIQDICEWLLAGQV